MRVMIITDSLGLPRKEVSYENVRTDMLLNACKGKNIVAYTMLKGALTIKECGYPFSSAIEKAR